MACRGEIERHIAWRDENRVGQMIAASCLPFFGGRGRGKSELHRARCWVTPSPGDGKESATESRPPRGTLVSRGKGETVR